MLGGGNVTRVPEKHEEEGGPKGEERRKYSAVTSNLLIRVNIIRPLTLSLTYEFIAQLEVHGLNSLGEHEVTNVTFGGGMEARKEERE